MVSIMRAASVDRAGNIACTSIKCIKPSLFVCCDVPFLSISAQQFRCRSCQSAWPMPRATSTMATF